MTGVTLLGFHLFQIEHGTNLDRRQHAHLILGTVVIVTLHIHLEETVEQNDFAGSGELLVGRGDANVDVGAFELCVGHLGGDGAFPDEFIEAAFIGRTLDGMLVKIGRTDGFVGFLGALGLGLVLACLHVFCAVVLGDFLLGREVHGVGTHVGDLTGFVKLLCETHGVSHRESQLAGGFLL